MWSFNQSTECSRFFEILFWVIKLQFIRITWNHSTKQTFSPNCSSYPVQNEADHSMEVPSDEFVPAAVSRVGLVTTVGGDTTSTASHIIPMPAVKSNLSEDKISEASSTPSVVVSSQMAAPSGPPPPPIQVPTTIHTERIMPTLATSLVKINMRYPND